MKCENCFIEMDMLYDGLCPVCYMELESLHWLEEQA